MKVVILFVMLSCATNACCQNPNSSIDNIELRQIQLWQEKLNTSSKLSEIEKFDSLQLGLRNLGYRRNLAGHNPTIDTLFEEIREQFLQSPSHAAYFKNKIEGLRKPGETEYAKTHARHEERYWLIVETLPQIPSPQVVELLGEYLYDDRDTPPPMLPTQDWIDVSANSTLAVSALGDIGLKNPPVKKADAYSKDDLETWKLWWEQVRSGTRTFSFEGKDIAYRFKKDGGVESLSAADAQRFNSESRVNMPKEQRLEEIHSISRQTWVIILLIFVLMIGLSLMKWRKA